jgi:hypothetical protein
MVPHNRIWPGEENLQDDVTVDVNDKKLCQSDHDSDAPIPIEKGLEVGNCAFVVGSGSQDNKFQFFRSLDFQLEKMRIGIANFQRSALLSGSMLDEAVANVFKAVHLSSSSSVLFTR